MLNIIQWRGINREGVAVDIAVVHQHSGAVQGSVLINRVAVVDRHRCIIHRGHRECSRILVPEGPRISGPERDRLCPIPIRIGNPNRRHTAGIDHHHQLGIARVRPRHLRIGVVNIGDVVIQVDRSKCAAFSNRLIGNIRYHRRFIHIVDGNGEPLAVSILILVLRLNVNAVASLSFMIK